MPTLNVGELMSYKRVVLRPMLIQENMVCSYAEFERMSQLEAEIYKQLSYRLRAFLVKYSDHTEQVPTTWWHHFKQDCFPVWLLQKFPVKLRKVDGIRACPHLWQGRNEPHVEFLMWEPAGKFVAERCRH